MKPAFQTIEQARHEMQIAAARSWRELQAGFVKNSRAYSDFADDAALYIARTSNAILADRTRFAKWAHKNADRAARQMHGIANRVNSRAYAMIGHNHRCDDLMYLVACCEHEREWMRAEIRKSFNYRSLIGKPVTIKVKP